MVWREKCYQWALDSLSRFKKDRISKQCILVEENQKTCILALDLLCMTLEKSHSLSGLREGKQLIKFTQKASDTVRT